MHIINAIKLGGLAVYPLLALAIISLALIIDKIIFYKNLVRLPKTSYLLIESYDFSWDALKASISRLKKENCYRRFFLAIIENHKKPAWWLESRALDEAKLVEKDLARGLWVLETIVTAAPLLGLFGTIIGMMDAFKLIGSEGLINSHGPNGVTAGVAQALIATAIGIFIAIYSLFAYNFFSRTQDQVMDELERLGTRMIDHVKLDQEKSNTK